MFRVILGHCGLSRIKIVKPLEVAESALGPDEISSSESSSLPFWRRKRKGAASRNKSSKVATEVEDGNKKEEEEQNNEVDEQNKKEEAVGEKTEEERVKTEEEGIKTEEDDKDSSGDVGRQEDVVEGEAAARKKVLMVQTENMMHLPFEKTNEMKVRAQTSVEGEVTCTCTWSL